MIFKPFWLFFLLVTKLINYFIISATVTFIIAASKCEKYTPSEAD